MLYNGNIISRPPQFTSGVLQAFSTVCQSGLLAPSNEGPGTGDEGRGRQRLAGL